MKIGFIITIALSLNLSVQTFAQKNSILLSKDENILYFNKTDVKKNNEITSVYGYFNNLSTENKKSYTKGVIFSLILPGGGEYYTGNYLKGTALTAVEVLCWAAFFKYDRLGNEKEDEFEAFADAHWNPEGYREWLNDYVTEHGSPPDNFTHTLPETKTQQYYEMIGKYEQFAPWWDDYDEEKEDSDRRHYYMDIRYKSNQYLKIKRTSTMIMIVNRILSVFDTAFTIKKHNQKVKKDVYIGLRYKRIKEKDYGLSLIFNW